jgi:hypothetical protein
VMLCNRIEISVEITRRALLGLLSHPEDGGSTFLRYLAELVQYYKASHPRLIDWLIEIDLLALRGSRYRKYFLWNARKLQPDYTGSYPRRQ